MTADDIQHRLKKAITSEVLKVTDESPMHAGHQADGAHFRILIVSKEFVGLSLVDRHRKIYGILDMGNNPEIHALVIQAKTPEEASR